MPNSVALPNVPLIWLPRVAEAVVVLFAAWLVAGWLTGGVVDQLMRNAVNSDVGVQPPNAVEIASFPLFGKRAIQPPAQAPPPVATAPTRLNIRLLGTVVAGDRSLAVMQLDAGEEKVVFVGEDIQPGVTLDQVEPDAIVVDNRGRKEKVLMARGSLGSAGQPYSPPAASGAAVSGQRTFTREAIREQMQDLPKLLTGALAIPHQTDGNPDGFLIQDIVPGSLYEQAGLINGDVIRSVNGQEVSSPEKGLALFQQLQTASSLDLEITRAGTVQQLHFDIR